MGSTVYLVRWIFLRALGLIYFLAFASLCVQIKGLIGHNGISPADAYLSWAASNLGPERYFEIPSLFWLNPSDGFLQFLALSGAVLALPVVLDLATAPLLAVLFALYLSLTTIGSDFLSFQWDALLLETGFISIFFAPWQLISPMWKPAAVEAPPSKLVLWLLRWLLFRVVFMSGAVKLLSGDPNWRNLTALDFHYLTQPLPTPIAWYAAQLPQWFQKFSVVSMFGVELLVPLLIFLTRGTRVAAAALMCFLQILIAATGNYTFFNLLVIALCVLLLDDRLLSRITPNRLKQAFIKSGSEPVRRPLAQTICCWAVGVTLWSLSISEVAQNFVGPECLPPPAEAGLRLLSPLHIINGYGVFAVMTTRRIEILVQGSNDGEHWLDYQFPYKPGDLKRPPPWVAPHQPRLDWQMWFAALGSCENNPWFLSFMLKLLQGSPDVLALLEKNPFPEKPPAYIRAVTYDYHFTDILQKSQTGDWWRRSYEGVYFPEASLHRK